MKKVFALNRCKPNILKFSINGHGMPDLHSGRRGNMYVTINAKVPKGLSQDEITMLQKLRKRLDKKGIDY